MKVYIGNMMMDGDPSEIATALKLINGGKKVETADKTPRRGKDIDWAKAKALKTAGWNYKDIATELGVAVPTVVRHLKEQA